MQRKYQIYFVLMKESIEPSNVFDGTIGCNILSFQDLTCSIHQDPKKECGAKYLCSRVWHLNEISKSLNNV